MLLFLDLADARQRLFAGELDCPRPGCAGTLGPWGSARPRTVRINASVTEQYRPRRARCRDCHSTQVLASTRTFPRRLDTAATVGSALMAASTGLGYRRVAERLDLPATTVRGWLRRARANATEISSAATRRTIVLDPMADLRWYDADPLIGMLAAIGQAVRAHLRRFGLGPDPWSVAVTVTQGRLLAPPAMMRTLLRLDSS